MTTPEPGAFFFGGATDALGPTSSATLGDLQRDPYAGELSFFGANPNVAGMATEDDRVILNPNLSDAARKSVFLNEASRVLMRQQGTPDFALTPDQTASFAGTPYESAPAADQRGTIMGRAISGDPSAGTLTPEQQVAAGDLRRRLFQFQPPPVWQPPSDSLVGWPSNADRADAADIARNLGGTMFAQPGAALDPNGRPVLINEDGSMSTERNIGVSDPRLNKGRHTNIPSIQEGRQLSVNQAIDWALKSGIQYPSFDTPEAADAAAIARHRKLEPAGQGQPGQIVLPPIQNTPDFMNDELTAHLMQMLLGRQGQ